MLTAVVCMLLVAWALLRLVSELLETLDTGAFYFGFGIVENIFETTGNSDWNTFVTFCLVINQLIFSLSNWVTFSLGMISCVVIYGVSKDYLRYINRWESTDERYLKVRVRRYLK